jgi:hypothetical protein
MPDLNDFMEKRGRVSFCRLTWRCSIAVFFFEKYSGRKEEYRSQLLTVLMRLRLGEVPESVREGLRRTSVKQLEAWSVLLVEATNLKDLRASSS